eukprot:EG_transcript_9086
MVVHVNLRSENFRAEVHGADLKALFRVIRKQAERPNFWTAWLRDDSAVDGLGDPRRTAEWCDRVLDCFVPSRAGPISKEADLSRPPSTPVSITADGRSQILSLTSAEGLVPSPQPAALVHLTLTRYQQQGLTWLRAREAPSDAPRRPHPIWEEMPIHEYNESEGCLAAVPGAQVHFNVDTGEVSDRPVFVPPLPRGGILADEMGMGKTVQMLALLAAEAAGRAEGNALATLIVCPNSVLQTWKAEVEAKVRPGLLSMLVYHGVRKGLTALEEFDVVLTTYGAVRKEYAHLRKVRQLGKQCRVLAHHLHTQHRTKECENAAAEEAEFQDLRAKLREAVEQQQRQLLLRAKWRRVVLDEAHFIRNRATDVCEAVRALDAQARWCLTGTPVLNGLDDLLGMLQFLRMPVFSEARYWREFIAEPYKLHDDKGLQRLTRVLDGLMLRRTKDERTSDG